jgi:hypothetical protein
MFGKLLTAALPSWVPLILGVVLIAGAVGGYYMLRSAWQAEGAKACEASTAIAVEAQRTQDAATSARLVEQQQAYIHELEQSSQQVREEIRYVPVTNTCGPSVKRAADWVRDKLAPGAGGSPAGR